MKPTILTLALSSTCFLSLLLCSPSGAETIHTTGEAVPALKPFDDVMIDFMSPRHVPGGSLAVAKDGRLVYARGYGWADRDKHDPVQPTSLFRIASLSKMITGVAIMKLLEKPSAHLTMQTRAFEYLNQKPLLSPGQKVDERIWQITIRDLLHHRGGWDREKSGDPMFDHLLDFAQLAHLRPLTDPLTMVRAMMGKPLDFDPGDRESYSNFGYCVLGRVIEKASGMSYEQYVRQHVLEPIGIHDMRLGRTLEQDRAPGEVHYYQDDLGLSPSIFPDGARMVPNPYGAWCLETLDAHGGWIASAVDMARFITGIDRLLKPATLQLLRERPPLKPGEKPQPAYYACGLMAIEFHEHNAATYTLWHNGSLPGTFSLLVRRHDGITWVCLFNQRESDAAKLPDMAIDAEFHRAADAVTHWPGWNWFGGYAAAGRTTVPASPAPPAGPK